LESKRAAVAKAGMMRSKAGTFEIVEAQRFGLKQ
jgi:hypothetical protein